MLSVSYTMFASGAEAENLPESTPDGNNSERKINVTRCTS